LTQKVPWVILLDAAGDAEAVELAGADGFEDEEVEGSLEEAGLILIQRLNLLSSGYTSVHGLPTECQ
jgi:hypothetical protein